MAHSRLLRPSKYVRSGVISESTTPAIARGPLKRREDARTRDPRAGDRPSDGCTSEAAATRSKRDAGLPAHPVEQVEEVLRRQVSGGSRGVRTACRARRPRSRRSGRPERSPSHDVRERRPARVVEVEGEPLRAGPPASTAFAHDLRHLRRDGDPDRVADRDLVAPELRTEPRRDRRGRLRGDRPLVGAAEDAVRRSRGRGCPAALARASTGAKSRERLRRSTRSMFWRLNVSEAAVKTAISRAPARGPGRALSRSGTRTG